MEKKAFELPLIRAFHLDELQLHSRNVEIWKEGETLVEYAPFPGLHSSPERYQKYIASELDFLRRSKWAARDIFFHGLIKSGEKDIEHLQKFRIIKVKCARHPLANDLQYFHFLAKKFPRAKFRIDANRLWSAENLQEFVNGIELNRVDYFEEPTPYSRELTRDYPIALDETIHEWQQNPDQLKSVKAIVLKPHLCKSIQQVLAWIEWGNKNRIPIVLSSLFNSSVGTQNLLRLACLCFRGHSPRAGSLFSFGCGHCRKSFAGQW